MSSSKWATARYLKAGLDAADAEEWGAFWQAEWKRGVHHRGPMATMVYNDPQRDAKDKADVRYFYHNRARHCPIL